MLLVIVGAGASFDALSNRASNDGRFGKLVERLPLANELFEDRPLFRTWMKQFGRCLPVIPYLQNNPNVESVLEKLQSEGATNTERLHQLAAIRFYLQAMIWKCELDWENSGGGQSNYKTLIDSILHRRKSGEHACLVTFNYDTMLESALKAFGIAVDDLPDYVKDQKISLIKLHGSVDWVRPILTPALDIQNGNQMEAALKMINCAPEIKLSRDHLFKATGEPPFAIVDRNACFPAIAIPVEKKDHFECPIEHVRFLQDFIPKVSKILVIGWKAAEMHFRRLLEGLNGVQSVMVVDPMDSIDQTVATFRQIKPFPGTVQFERLKCGFSQAIVTQQIDSFLNS